MLTVKKKEAVVLIAFLDIFKNQFGHTNLFIIVSSVPKLFTNITWFVPLFTLVCELEGRLVVLLSTVF